MVAHNQRPATPDVADHYDRLDYFYRHLWGEHVHHGLWERPDMTTDEAVRHLVHRVAQDAALASGTTICDVGCGYGAPARLWAKVYGAEVTGFTISEVQYAVAGRPSDEEPDLDLRLQDFQSNDLPDASMDAVVLVESLTHLDEPEGVLEEADRLLRPEGRLVACVWMSAVSPPRWAQQFLLDPICEEGRLSGLPTATDLYRMTARAGLSIRRLDDVTAQVRHTWTVVLRRFLHALVTDATVLRTLCDVSESERVFARTLLRVWLAQYLGVLRYGWLVAEKP